MKKSRLFVFLMVIILITLSSCGAPKTVAGDNGGSDAVSFPEKDLHIVVPYDAGGGVDITTRVFTDLAVKNELLNGKTIIVENRGGGGAVVGHTYVANQPNDGYTILAFTNAVVSNPLLKETTYKTEDFKELAMICFDPDIVVTPPNSDINSLEDLIAIAKTKPLKVATPGHSTIHHSAAVLFAKENGLKFEYLHSDSSAVQMQQVMGGHCDVAFMSVGEATAQIQDETIKGIAVMSDERIEAISSIPTFKENGFDLTYGAFRGYAVRKDVPDAAYEVLKRMFEEVGQSEELKDALTKANIPYEYRGADSFIKYVSEYKASLDEILPILMEDSK